MHRIIRQRAVLCTGLLIALGSLGCAADLIYLSPYVPEQRSIDVRTPPQLMFTPLPNLPPPATVTNPEPDAPEQPISLDEAIRITLQNSEVVRVLAGVTAVSSGQTIYDPAIANTVIDQEQARFDPNVDFNHRWDRIETPRGEFATFSPALATITGERTDQYDGRFGLSQVNALGGVASLDVTDRRTLVQPGTLPLNPQNRYDVTLNYTQPLLQGGGLAPNIAPIVIARINTERSFYQLKDSLQDSVRGVIEAYWGLVFARTDAWARAQQVEQGQFALDLANARQRTGRGTAADVAQSRLALANFKANLIAADANVLQREAALRNIMGLPPSGTPRLIPVSPPNQNRLPINWPELLSLAAERRPDIIERKLIIEADYQRLIQAQNGALPQLDAFSLYRWNGLEGTTPNGSHLTTQGGEFTDWTIGLNFSLPVGLRQGRAVVRQQELTLIRDRANLEQSLHATAHELATSTRDLAQFYDQYEAQKEARAAARENLQVQEAVARTGLRQEVIFLNVLQAIADWGNTVSGEAQALAQYNTELAVLEQRTGTILETHGIQFYEDRFASKGPLGCLAPKPFYPSDMRPGPNLPLYPVGKEPAENFFDLKPPVKLPGKE